MAHYFKIMAHCVMGAMLTGLSGYSLVASDAVDVLQAGRYNNAGSQDDHLRTVWL